MQAAMKDTLTKVIAPIGKASGLPNAFYTDAALHEAERTRIFQQGWCAVGFGKDVAEAGAAWPVEFLGMPLLIVKDQANRVRVFQNVCRHRGMILVDKPKQLSGLIRCPYHSWCYELSGQLRATPHVGGPGNNVHDDVDRSKLGLIEVRSHVWMDVVFMNVSGTAPDFQTHAADLIARCAEFGGVKLYHGGPDSSFSLELKTNWKLAVENYCESYHLPWVHPGLNSYSRLEDHYNMVEASFSGQGTKVYNLGPGPNGQRFSKFAGLSAKWQTGAEYPSFFPNLLFGFQNDHYFAILIEPKGAGHCVEHVEIYYSDADMTSEAYAGMRARNTAMWKGIFVEDIAVVEGMQRGRQAPGFDGGKFSPVMDPPTHRFHQWVAQRFLAAA